MQMIIEATALTSCPGQFAASMGGSVIVERTRMPLLDGARAILATSNSTYALVMQYSTSPGKDCLRTTVGVAAQLTVVSAGNGEPTFARWKV